jgi:hypothetical protein
MCGVPTYKHICRLAAVGDYWMHRVVYHKEVPRAIGDFFDVTLWDGLAWPSYVVLGTPESDKRLRAVHEFLAAKPRLNLDSQR